MNRRAQSAALLTLGLLFVGFAVLGCTADTDAEKPTGSAGAGNVGGNAGSGGGSGATAPGGQGGATRQDDAGSAGAQEGSGGHGLTDAWSDGAGGVAADGGGSGAGGAAPGVTCGGGYCSPSEFCCRTGQQQQCTSTGTGCAGISVHCTAGFVCPSGKECCVLPGELGGVGTVSCVTSCSPYGDLVCKSDTDCAGTGKSCSPVADAPQVSTCQ